MAPLRARYAHAPLGVVGREDCGLLDVDGFMHASHPTPWVCMECGHRQADMSACGACGDSPLLDLRVPLTRDTLAEVDDRRRSKRGDRIRYASVPVGVVVVLLACELVPGVSAVLARILPFFFGYVVAMIGVALGAMFAVNAALPWKPRFPYLAEFDR